MKPRPSPHWEGVVSRILPRRPLASVLPHSPSAPRTDHRRFGLQPSQIAWPYLNWRTQKTEKLRPSYWMHSVRDASSDTLQLETTCLEIFLLVFCTVCESFSDHVAERGETRALVPGFLMLITPSSALLLTLTELGFCWKSGVQAGGRGRKAFHCLRGKVWRVGDSNQLLFTCEDTGIQRRQNSVPHTLQAVTESPSVGSLDLFCPLLPAVTHALQKIAHLHTSVFGICCHFSIWNHYFLFAKQIP